MSPLWRKTHRKDWDMKRSQMIRIAHANPHIRERVLRVIEATDYVAELQKESGRGLPISKLMRYAQNGVFILSAYRNEFSRRENKLRNEELRQRLLALGVPLSKIVKLDSQWEELGSDVVTKEKSLIALHPVSWRDALSISNHYEQDGFIWSSPNNPLALYDSVRNTATFAVDNRMAVQLTLANNEELYSKGRGSSFDIGFNKSKPLRWDGRTPITRDDVIEALGA